MFNNCCNNEKNVERNKLMNSYQLTFDCVKTLIHYAYALHSLSLIYIMYVKSKRIVYFKSMEKYDVTNVILIIKTWQFIFVKFMVDF